MLLHDKFIGASRSEPHINHSYEKNRCTYVCMYVCMCVAIRRPRVYYAVCVCAYRNSVKIINVDRMLTLSVAHQSRRTEQQHEQPASYSRQRLREQHFER